MLSSKIHILSFRDPIDVVQIFLCSMYCLVFIKNMKHAMFCYEKWSYKLSLLFMYEKKEIISL
jgi:hypothetical protein